MVLPLLVLGVALLDGIPTGIVADAWAQASLPSTEQFPGGTVTAVGSNTIQVDKKDYQLDPKVTIKDLLKKPRSLKDIGWGTSVRFHLNKKGRIDQLILMIPD